MGTVSSTWPWLIELSARETDQFFKDLQDATMADSHYEIAEKIDYTVANTKRLAEERREAENEKFRRSLLEEARTAQDRAKLAEEQAERAERRADRLVQERDELREKLSRYQQQEIREFLMEIPEGRKLLFEKAEKEEAAACEAEAVFWNQMPTTIDEEAAGE